MQTMLWIYGLVFVAMALAGVLIALKVSARMAQMQDELAKMQKRMAENGPEKQKSSIWLAKTQAMRGGGASHQIIEDPDPAEATLPDVDLADPARVS